MSCAWFVVDNTAFADDEDAGRRIEEVVVYGERVESTVSDTSISITAMDSEFLSDMGIQGPNEMMNFIPATTRTDWDVKIRGIGRNFRGLGGDAGVGTYYNGIYSGDFGIAATEGGLFDLERIEVLRGPQGTLYGRNSIGGVINYVTKKPNSDEHEAAVRLIVGQYSTHEFYGMTTGPITEDLAYRFTGVKRKRDFAVPGHAGSEGGEDINDQNFAIQFDYQVNDNMSAWLRFNERRSLRVGNFGSGGTKSYPRSVGTGSTITDPFSGKFIVISGVTADTFNVGVGTATLGINNPHTFVSAYTNGLQKAGEPVLIAPNSINFQCSQDNYTTTHQYPRPGTDPIAGVGTPITGVGNTTITLFVGIGTDSDHRFVAGLSSATNAVRTGGNYPHTFVSATSNGLRKAGESIRLSDNGLTFKCEMDDYATVHTYPRYTDPGFSTSLGITSTTPTAITLNVGTSRTTNYSISTCLLYTSPSPRD